ncbi:MAG: division/cell wall cluster transcriptional repressor MraZ [Chiayiivirga sp.]|jgi:MraZ protein|nr:division/cell wall cluster transcriptional repressor MraZ [Chiayiivirga sp.]
MFQGENSITIDDKGRLAIPTAYRDLVARECGNRLVVTYNPWERGCLWLYPHAEWERVRDEVNRLPMAKPGHRQLQLKLVGAATFVDVDGSGRILVPASHRNASAIDRKAVLLGMGGKFELWSEQAHLEQVQKTIAETDVSEAMLELVL